jgi:exopolysaccharide biosynthesis polyprenyl glycosylphosphotransferase
MCSVTLPGRLNAAAFSRPALGLSVADSVAIIGPPERAAIEARRITGATDRPPRIEVFSDRVVERDERGRIPKTDIDRLAALVRSRKIVRILVATPAEERQRIAAVVKQLEGMAVDVDLILDGIPTYSRLRLGISDDVCLARILRRPLTPTQALLKSIMDKTGALVLLVLIAPMLLAIAMMVKFTSPGPIIFRQKRFGLNNAVFEVLKFRTLHHRHADPNAQHTVKRQDGRVTAVGGVLRALSLDELPQLVNVLKGEMSLVGPRPLPVDLKIGGKPCQEFPHYRARHRVRPGITGLAQVKGCRGGMEVSEELRRRLACDLAYIDNYSLVLDLKIAIGTAAALLWPRNAY